MKLQSATHSVESTVQGEKVALRIDTSALTKIMAMLTDLYQDAVGAIIREYSTNALDAHVMVGEQRPIEVSTPTALRPTFTVRDYGPGLDADDIREIYTAYGASTKSESDDQVGAFGLGCKSALAYVDQFNLTAWKDGVRTVVSIGRDEDGAASCYILEQEPDPDAPSGVEVNVPSKRGTDWEGKAAKFFAYWSPGTVQVNGAEPEPLDGFDLGDGLMVCDRDTYQDEARLTLVMGNVPYPVPMAWTGEVNRYGRNDSSRLALPYDKRLVARVPIGTFTIPPNRESVQDTAKSKNAVTSILDKFKARATVAVQEAVDKADNRTAAINARTEACESLGLDPSKTPITWKGADVPYTIDIPGGLSWNGAHRHRYGSPKDRSTWNNGTVAELAQATYVTGYDNAEWTPTQRKKLDRYMEVVCGESDGGDVKVALLRTGQGVPGAPWTDDCRRIDWSDVRKWKDPDAAKAAPGARTFAGTYPCYEPDNRWMKSMFPAKDIDLKRPVYYVVCTMEDAGGWYKEAKRYLGDHEGTYTLVFPNSNRAEKFKRTFPEAKELKATIREKAAEWVKNLTADEKAALWLFGRKSQSWDRSYIGQSPRAFLALTKAEDPDLARASKLAHLAEGVRSGREKWGQYVTVPESKTSVPDTKGLLAKYPLLRYAEGGDSDSHRLLYVNHIHNTTEESK